MQFSDTTNKSGLIQHCELLTGLGDATISGNTTLLKQFTAALNRAYHKAVTMILASQDDWDFDDFNNTDFPIGTTPLVASQRDYTFPASLKILKIKRVDVTYDGTNYYLATPMDSTEIPVGLGNNTLVDAGFEKTTPRFDVVANAVMLYPTASAADVAAGGLLRVEFIREITEFASSDTTAKPGFDTPFHPLISVIASHEYAIANELLFKASELDGVEADWEARLKQHYGDKEEARTFAFGDSLPSYK